MSFKIAKVLDRGTNSMYPVLFTERHLKQLIRSGDTPLKLTGKEMISSKRLYKSGSESPLIKRMLTGETVIASVDPNSINTGTVIFNIKPSGLRAIATGGSIGDAASYGVKEKEEAKPRVIPLHIFRRECRRIIPTIPEDGITSNIDLETLSEALGIRGFRVICDLKEIKDSEIQEGEYVIINISRIPDETGHWVMAARSNAKNMYFDSFGCTPCKEVASFLMHKYIGADAQMQKIAQSDCGLRCEYVIMCLQRNESFIDIIDRMSLD